MLKTNYHMLNLANKNRPQPLAGAVFGLRMVLILMIFSGIVLGVVTAFKNDSVPGESQSFAAASIPNSPDPVELNIPSLKIKAPFVPLGLKANRSIEVPKGDKEVGWYKYGPKPGDIGPAVVVGHLDSTRGLAVFANLKKIKPGDKIFVKRADGSEVAFKVDSISKYPQDKFPTNEVYGPINHAGLRLVTCTGTYSKKLRRYSDNLIVFASMVPN